MIHSRVGPTSKIGISIDDANISVQEQSGARLKMSDKVANPNDLLADRILRISGSRDIVSDVKSWAVRIIDNQNLGCLIYPSDAADE